MLLRQKISMIFLSILLANFPIPTLAFQGPDGKVTFDKSPRLIDAYTTFDDVRAWGAKYYFIIGLPEDIGEPLKTVVIQQREGVETIDFHLEKTRAFLGHPNRKDEEIPIESVIYDEENDSITIILEQPVAPGNTVTIGLYPYRNPYYEGIYLFGVTAFPDGEKPLGLYLGVGRLHFYQDYLWW